MKHATVDFSKVTGKIKPMHAVNNSPFGNARGLGTMTAFKEAGFPYARNHDAAHYSEYGGSHAHDVLNIFPDFDADVNDPANYDFDLTDKTIQDTEDAGCRMFYRLGSKIEHESKKYQTKPPKDFKKWAQICEHIIAHTCYGWANGHRFDIEYWEIWNEADGFNADGTKACWQGTMEQFIDFFEVAAKHLKACYPEKKIGGPAYTGEPYSWGDIEQFIVEAGKRGIPLDFFSWHGYATDPHHYERSVARVRELLDANGFEKTELILNEWNYVKGWVHEDMLESYRTIHNEKGAAFVAASVLTAQKTPMDMFMYYDAAPSSAFTGIFEPWTFKCQKPYYALWQFNKLYRLKKELFTSTDSEEIYIGAAGDEGNLAIQLAYFSDVPAEEETVELAFRGLAQPTEFQTLLVDKDHTNEPLRSDICTVSEGKLYLRLRPNSVVLITGSPVR